MAAPEPRGIDCPSADRSRCRRRARGPGAGWWLTPAATALQAGNLGVGAVADGVDRLLGGVDDGADGLRDVAPARLRAAPRPARALLGRVPLAGRGCLLGCCTALGLRLCHRRLLFGSSLTLPGRSAGKRHLRSGRAPRLELPGCHHGFVAPKLPDDLRLGPVRIAVTHRDRSVPFYEDSIGLQVHHSDNGTVAMGTGGEDLALLEERPHARPAGRHAGLYHYALLHPSREELARAAKRLLVTRTPISGASDHGISEAIYLPDPDGNGIELAADRGRERWGDLSDPKTIGPEPLDMNGLLDLVEGQDPNAKADPGLVVGHVHLHVGDVEEGLRFYRDLVGFEVMTRFPTAAFVSAGGYHHHLAFNTWRGERVPPAPPEAVGLRRWTVVLDRESLAALRERVAAAGVEHQDLDGGLLLHDPWNNAVLFTA